MYSVKATETGSDDGNVNLDDTNDEWVTTELSEDHKPDLPIEHTRITKKFDGRVLSYVDANGNPVGPARVWLKTQNIPGLAMSRSIGDVVAHSVGVECEPEIKEFTLKKQDRILVIASDGLWEFMDNQEVLDTILPFYKKSPKHPEKAIDKLVSKATMKWQKEEDVVDDTTVIVAYLKVT